MQYEKLYLQFYNYMNIIAMWVKTIFGLPNCLLNQYDTERKVGFKLCIDLLVAYGLFRRMFKNYHLLSSKH